MSAINLLFFIAREKQFIGWVEHYTINSTVSEVYSREIKEWLPETASEQNFGVIMLPLQRLSDQWGIRACIQISLQKNVCETNLQASFDGFAGIAVKVVGVA